MIQKGDKSNQQDDVSKAYEAIVQSMRNLYKGNISDQEAHQAAQNLIGFCRTLLKMKAEQDRVSYHV